jgi:hypothetical protein
MKDTIRVTGTVSYHNLGTGFWGITDTKGNDWLPVNMPEQLKVEGAKVRCTMRRLDDYASTAMWGVPVKVISFQTPDY